MILWAIRHKATQKLMPLFQKNRGYSHWNPAIITEPLKNETKIPRFLKTKESAIRVIAQWNSMPNAAYRGGTNPYGDDDYSIGFKPDGRTREDLEVVMVSVEILHGIQK